jgi:glycosyltransferase involved in cell wall biosynthesis
MNVDMVLPYTLDNPRSGVSGTARVLFDLANGFVKRKIPTRIIAKADPSQPRQEQVDGYEIERISSAPLPGLANRLLNQRLDSSFILPLIIRNLQQPSEVMMTFNDPWPCLMPRASFKAFSLHIPNPHLTPKNRLVQEIMDADVTICCSDYVARRVSRYAPRISRRITYVLNGIDPRPFEQADGSALRQRLGIGPDEVVLLYAGQISPLKGLANLIEALRDVRSRLPNVRLLVLGSSKLWPTYDRRLTNRSISYESQTRAEAADLPVHFAGVVSEAEKPQYFAAADIFVCPSVWNEPFGLSNLEAMAAGKPVVASRVGGIPEVVRDQETGILVNPGEKEPLANAITLLGKSEETRLVMGSKGSMVAKSDFSLDRMVDDYIRVLK